MRHSIYVSRPAQDRLSAHEAGYFAYPSKLEGDPLGALLDPNPRALSYLVGSRLRVGGSPASEEEKAGRRLRAGSRIYGIHARARLYNGEGGDAGLAALCREKQPFEFAERGGTRSFPERRSKGA